MVVVKLLPVVAVIPLAIRPVAFVNPVLGSANPLAESMKFPEDCSNAKYVIAGGAPVMVMVKFLVWKSPFGLVTFTVNVNGPVDVGVPVSVGPSPVEKNPSVKVIPVGISPVISHRFCCGNVAKNPVANNF